MTWIWHFAEKYTWCCNIHVISMGYDIKWGVCERVWVSRWSRESLRWSLWRSACLSHGDYRLFSLRWQFRPWQVARNHYATVASPWVTVSRRFPLPGTSPAQGWARRRNLTPIHRGMTVRAPHWELSFMLPWHAFLQTYDGIFAAAPTTVRGQPSVLSVDSKVSWFYRLAWGW